jgi:hypothetical protein
VLWGHCAEPLTKFVLAPVQPAGAAEQHWTFVRIVLPVQTNRGRSDDSATTPPL